MAPQIRAAQTQSLLSAVRRLPDAETRRILALAAPESLPTVEGALGVTWLPMAVHMDLSDAIRDTIGPDRNVELWRRAMTIAFERPLLRSFVRMTTSLLGLTPMSLVKRSESLYEHITRDLGRIRFNATSPTSAVIELSEFPAHAFRFICYVEGLQGCLLACLDVCRATGTATVTAHDSRAGTVTYLLEWEDAP